MNEAGILASHELVVSPDWIDYNGHMSEAWYLVAFGNSMDAFFHQLGIDEQYRKTGFSFFTQETWLCHKREARADTAMYATLQLLDYNRKRLLIAHQLYHRDERLLLATAEQIVTYVDLNARHSHFMPDALLRQLHVVQLLHCNSGNADRLEAKLKLSDSLVMSSGSGNVQRKRCGL